MFAKSGIFSFVYKYALSLKKNKTNKNVYNANCKAMWIKTKSFVENKCGR